MPRYHQHLTKHQDPNKTQSKRWNTTTRSALEETAHQLLTNVDRYSMVTEMKNRKHNNTKTSIIFGNEKINYISDAMENQKKCFGDITPEERQLQKDRIKTMKQELTATNFRLGDEKPYYASVNHDAMKEAESFGDGRENRSKLNLELKESIKRSSLNFGNEKVNYVTVAQESMKAHNNENDFAKIKNDVTNLKINLRKHNFTFGDEKISYVSDYNSGYGNIPLESFNNADVKKRMKEKVEDSRSCHFVLGCDRPNYTSNTHEALKIIENNTFKKDVKAEAERAKAMRQALQRTSIVIGDDTEYY